MQGITDILAYTRRLKEAGEPEKVAEMHAEMLAKIIETNIATKQDIELLRSDIKQDIELLRSELITHDSKIGAMDAKIGAMDTKIGAMDTKIGAMDTKIEAVDTKLNWLVSLVGIVGIILAALNLWHIYHP